MKTASPMLESLEPRIAPAGVVFTNGANLLSAGDEGYLSEADSDGDATMLVKVTGGKAMVFWDAEASQIKGISVSNGANIEIWGNVYGDIVTNLQNSGFLSDSDSDPSNGLDGGKLLGSSIAGIKTNAYFDSHGSAQNGDIERIISGGSISKVNLNGRLHGIYAGDGIFDAIETATSSVLAEGTAATSFTYVLGKNYDTSGLSNISTMTLTMGNAAIASGASINGLSFSSGINVQIFAGDGASGAIGGNGGSVSTVDFVGGIVDVDITTNFFAGKSFTISSGDGGNGTSGNGGAGGNINGVSETGSGGNASILAGHGGNAELLKGKAGNGGSISNLDLQGGVVDNDIQAGAGGNGAFGGSGGGVSYVNITSRGTFALEGPFLDSISNAADNNNFLVINRSTSEMALIWSTSTTDPGTQIETVEWHELPIAALAAGISDAITADLNDDGYLDVAMVYSDGHLGILMNKGAATTEAQKIAGDVFDYSVAQLGYEPSRILAGNFLGEENNQDENHDDTGLQELAIISTNKLQTTVRLYSSDAYRFDYLDENTTGLDASTYITNTLSAVHSGLFKPLVIKKGNLVDAAGGDSPGNGAFMQLNPTETSATKSSAHSDIVLAFADGTLQGVIATGNAKPYDETGTNLTDAPFVFSIKDAPKTSIGGGIRDMDFNYGSSSEGSSDQGLAIINKAGTAAFLVTIAPAPVPDPVEGQPTPEPSGKFVFNTQAPLPLWPNSGTLLQASWLKTSLSGSEEAPALALLSSTSTASRLQFYTDYDTETGVFNQASVFSRFDYQVNSMAENSLFSGKVDAYYFTTGNLTLGVTVTETLPPTGPTFAYTYINQPFEGKEIHITSGQGGTGTSGAGGNGGDLKSLNFDSESAEVTAGNGGTSLTGAGGNGGSINNSGTFRTASATITPSMGSINLVEVRAGNGASVTGSGIASKGGNGGSISGVTFTTIEDFGSLAMFAGQGGDSESLSAGNGGSIFSTKVFSANNVYLVAGNGGTGSSGIKAAGGDGGSVTGLIGGDPVEVEGKTRFIVGSVEAWGGTGGASDFAKAGNGGSVGTINVQNMEDDDLLAQQELKLLAGNGGVSGGTDKTANGGNGGSITGVISENTDVAPTITAGHGGAANGGNGGNGGSIANLKYIGGIIDLASGNGGTSANGIGGSGGGLTSINADIRGSGYMSITSGFGGASPSGTGGTGGAISNLYLKLNPWDQSGSTDTTLGIAITSGQGGDGARGGNGGLVSGISCEGVYDNASNDGLITVLDSIAMKIVSGNGGEGATAEGGNGGAINFTKALLGLSQINSNSTNPNFDPKDEALRVFAGDGGNGATKGGTGGSISGLKAANVKNSLGDSIPTNLLGSAFVQSGNGGNGGSGDAGAGGAVSGTKLSVERHGSDLTGNLRVLTGTGGLSVSGKGGIGGAILNSSFTAVNGSNEAGYGVLLQTGDGGNGAKGGGAGGNLSTVTVSSTSLGLNGTNSDLYCAVVVAGDGGNGTGSVKSLGGAGGSILGLNQLKDNYSVINLVQAGSGGDSSADSAGGVGGSVSNLKSSGAIGAQIARALPTDPGIRQGLFNTIATSTLIDALIPDKHQGVFAGLGGSGLARGANGSVLNISAPAIAAIGAANISGDFESAAVVSKIATLLLGYDVNNGGTYNVGDGYVSAAKFDIAKDLISLDPEIVSTTNLIARTTPFVNP